MDRGSQHEVVIKTIPKNSLLNSVGEDEGGMIWENDIEACKN